MTRLVELRKSSNLLQKDIALHLGVDRTTYNKYEKGLSEPSIDTLKKLASLFEVSIDYLLEYSPPTQHSKTFSFSVEEKKLIDMYRNLSDEGKFEAMNFLAYAQLRYKKDNTVSNVANK